MNAQINVTVNAPEWVRYVAVDKNGRIYGYSKQPTTVPVIGRWVAEGAEVAILGRFQTEARKDLHDWDVCMWPVDDVQKGREAMTPDQTIAQALERLAAGKEMLLGHRSIHLLRYVPMELLAALIRAAAKPETILAVTGIEFDYCRACDEDLNDGHAPDCALIKLCEAIVGEQP